MRKYPLHFLTRSVLPLSLSPVLFIPFPPFSGSNMATTTLLPCLFEHSNLLYKYCCTIRGEWWKERVKMERGERIFEERGGWKFGWGKSCATQPFYSEWRVKLKLRRGERERGSGKGWKGWATEKKKKKNKKWVWKEGSKKKETERKMMRVWIQRVAV